MKFHFCLGLNERAPAGAASAKLGSDLAIGGKIPYIRNHDKARNKAPETDKFMSNREDWNWIPLCLERADINIADGRAGKPTLVSSPREWLEVETEITDFSHILRMVELNQWSVAVNANYHSTIKTLFPGLVISFQMCFSNYELNSNKLG